MRFGIGTILWGRRIDDLEYTLDLFKECGFQGVEFAQHHSRIFIRTKDGKTVRPLKDVEELLEQLGKRNLTLIGLVGGSLKDRMDFLKCHREPYLYMDRWPSNDSVFEQGISECLDRGFTIALHPHWLMPIHKIRHALDIIRGIKSKQVRLLLDIAHAAIAEDDPVKVINTPHDLALVTAVHLKDWRPDFGRWSHRYAHGFCLPGQGIVQPEVVMAALHENEFRGWVILEQDHFDYRREPTVLAGAQWMERNGVQWGFNVHVNQAWVEEKRHLIRLNPFTSNAEGFENKEFQLGKELSRTVAPNPEGSRFYSVVARKLKELFDAKAVKVWSHNPLTDDLCLVGMNTENPEWTVCKKLLSHKNQEGKLTLVGELAIHPHTCQKDLHDETVTACFADQEWLELIKFKARWMTVLPVFNISNQHQLRFLITIFTADSILNPEIDRKQLFPQFETIDGLITDKLIRSCALDRFGWVVAQWADSLTDQSCSQVSGATNHLCGNFKGGVTEFINVLMDYLERLFRCNSVTIFLKDNLTGMRLEPAGRSDEKLEWHGREHFYRVGDGLTGTAFAEREMVFNSHATTGNAREKRPLDDPRDEVLFAPLVRRNGECHGVVRLHNKNRNPENLVATMFTDDDAARLDAVIQTSLPYLELLMLQENQTQGIARMIHEYQSPLVGIRGAVDAMRMDFKRNQMATKAIFRRDFPELIIQWADLLGRLTRNWQVFAGGMGSLPPRPRSTKLRGDVVVPVLHQIRGLLPRGKRLEFEYRGFDDIPPLWIDRDQFQQVFFNLLSNSCKYGGGSETVRVEITAGDAWGSYCISYSDWGEGIIEGIKEKIFLPGFRSERAILSEMSGQGLGLFVVKSIVQAHGGTIKVTSVRNPTTFEIVLPKTLRNKLPIKAV